MGYFPSAIAEALAGREVKAALLVKFDFASGAMRVWNGYGQLNAGGFTWDGLGHLGNVEGLEQAMAGTAPQATFTLSGVSPSLLGYATGAASEYKNRLVLVYLQCFAADWSTLDAPYPIYFGLMDALAVQRPLRGEQDGGTRTLSLTAESLFARRSRPAYGAYSDRDQQARSPGDRFCERVAGLQEKTVVWPT